MKKVLAASIALILLLTGCSQTGDENAAGGNQQAAAPVLKYEIGSNDWSALEVYSPKDKVKEAYAFAVEHPEVLNYMPCYCGCFAEDGHKSNTDCFVDRVEDHVAILDTMGFGWGICVDIAREAKQEYQKGTDLKTIRDMIDKKYGGNGAEPTPTPKPI